MSGPKERGRESLLWHYTSLNSLEKILQGCLRFSHYAQLNDPNELRIVYEKWDELLGMAVNTEALQSAALSARVENVAPAVFCCSRNPDNLFCWLAYADSLKGVAIGFRTGTIEKPHEPHALPYIGYCKEEFAVSYSELELTSHLYDAIVRKLGPMLPSRTYSAGAEVSVLNAALSLAVEGIRYKVPAWRQEEEVRVIVRPTNDMVGRDTPETSQRWMLYGERKYIEVPFEPAVSIAEIRLAPHCKEGTVRAILKAIGLDGIRVTKSPTHVSADWPPARPHTG